MLRLLKRIWNKVRQINANSSHESKLKYLRAQGASIGDHTRLNCTVQSFGAEPYLVTVGENCLLAADVHFFTHDGGVKVLSDLGYFGGERMDIMAPIKVGNNVYIGTGASILPGVTIGNNCVIGASAVVTKDIPDNSVAVGIPARVIRNIEEYYKNAVAKGFLHPTAQMSAKDKKIYYLNLYAKKQ